MRSRDFHREQFGGTVGGPMSGPRKKAFTPGARRVARTCSDRISRRYRTPCPCVRARRLLANENAHRRNADCQRLALLGFFQSRRNQNEGLPNRPHHQQQRDCSRRWTGISPPQTSCPRRTTSTIEERQPDLRRGHVWHLRRTASRGRRRSNVLNVNLFTTLTRAG